MYHLFVTYLNVSPVCVTAMKMLILTVLFWFHHIVLFYACYVTRTKMIDSSVMDSTSNRYYIYLHFWHQLYIFCSVSQQMLCVCCKTLMSCFQIITHYMDNKRI